MSKASKILSLVEAKAPHFPYDWESDKTKNGIKVNLFDAKDMPKNLKKFIKGYKSKTGTYMVSDNLFSASEEGDDELLEFIDEVIELGSEDQDPGMSQHDLQQEEQNTVFWENVSTPSSKDAVAVYHYNSGMFYIIQAKNK